MKDKRSIKGIIATVLSTVLVAGILFCNFNWTMVSDASEGTTATLNVALYEYVPDPDRFEATVSAKWAELHPDVELNFISWDSYDADPGPELDVFVFDALFLTHFKEAGYLAPLSTSQVQNSGDILPFALQGCTMDGNIYAIPQIVCTNLLYSRENDSAMKDIDNVHKLYEVIGNNTSTEIIPNNNEGLLVDMSGGTTKACMFLDSLIDINQKYNDYYVLPDINNLNTMALNNLLMLQNMAGKRQASYWPDNNDSYIRATWFKEGKGRAYIGYTEAMCSMGNYIDNINFRTISLSNNTDIPLFYGDVVGVNSAITEARQKELAVELANVITAADTVQIAISPDSNNLYPQYLLPARISVYDYMKNNYPVYGKLKLIATNEKNQLFKAGPNVRNWLTAVKPLISNYLENN